MRQTFTMSIKYFPCYVWVALMGLQANGIRAQDRPVQFETFTGVVYKIPIKQLEKGYRNQLDLFDSIGYVELPQLDIGPTLEDIPFPGVDRKNRFGIMFNSKMTIEKEGCYHFNLASDDGSILWVDGIRMIDNDGPHDFTAKDTSIWLSDADYPIVIWYYNAYADQYGIEFHSKKVEDTLCAGKTGILQQWEVSADVLFELGSSWLSKKGKDWLSETLDHYQNESCTCQITGHADPSGSEEMNLILSKRRAERVSEYLKLVFPLMKVEVEARGELEPLYNDDGTVNMNKSRRVEILCTQ